MLRSKQTMWPQHDAFARQHANTPSNSDWNLHPPSRAHPQHPSDQNSPMPLLPALLPGWLLPAASLRTTSLLLLSLATLAASFTMIILVQQLLLLPRQAAGLATTASITTATRAPARASTTPVLPAWWRGRLVAHGRGVA